MKYLDEKIELTFNISQQGRSKTYPFYIFLLDTNIFNGNVYISGQQTDVKVDVTNVLRNFKYAPNNMKKPLVSNIEALNEDNFLISNVYCKIALDDTTLISSNTETVCFIYRYPNRKKIMETTLGQFFDPTAENERRITTGLQGLDLEKGYGYQLVPRIPYKLTDEYGFGFICEVGKKAVGEYEFLTNEDRIIWTTPLKANVTNPATNIFYNLNNLFENTQYITTETKEWYPDDLTTNNENWTETSEGYEINLTKTIPTGDILFTVYYERGAFGDQKSFETNGTFNFNKTYTKKAGENEIYILLNPFLDSSLKPTPAISFIFPNIETNKTINFSFDYKISDSKTVTILKDTISITAEEDLPEEDIYLCYRNRNNYLAKIDIDCFPKYYLLWQDRYGSYQSQPFDGVPTFKENYEKIEIMSPERRVVYNEAKPSWTIKTGWMTDEVFPYYESIFVSPYLLLYDVENDISYNVIVTGDYTERTFFNNDRQLFNLELNLEENKNQNILY